MFVIFVDVLGVFEPQDKPPRVPSLAILHTSSRPWLASTLHTHLLLGGNHFKNCNLSILRVTSLVFSLYEMPEEKSESNSLAMTHHHIWSTLHFTLLAWCGLLLSLVLRIASLSDHALACTFAARWEEKRTVACKPRTL